MLKKPRKGICLYGKRTDVIIPSLFQSGFQQVDIPVRYISKTSSPDVYAEEITRYVKEDFPDGLPEIILEPGRSLVAESGVLVTEVVLVSKKSNMGVDRWVYLDTGLFNGLIETIGESIKYPLYRPSPLRSSAHCRLR